jgi:predicted amidophosphoribosyltransferase
VRLGEAEILIVPSSREGGASEGLERIVEKLCKEDKRFTYRRGALYRHTAIRKLAKGGDRSLPVHLNSMGYKDDPYSPAAKIVLDDVFTTGNSIRGAITIVEQIDQSCTFLPIVLGKTTHD